MEGKILNFRSGRHTQHSTHMIVVVEGVNDKASASKLVGKSVVWQSPKKKEINGKIASAHGNKGCVRVIFEKGMPGQSLNTTINIV